MLDAEPRRPGPRGPRRRKSGSRGPEGARLRHRTASTRASARVPEPSTLPLRSQSQIGQMEPEEWGLGKPRGPLRGARKGQAWDARRLPVTQGFGEAGQGSWLPSGCWGSHLQPSGRKAKPRSFLRFREESGERGTAPRVFAPGAHSLRCACCPGCRQLGQGGPCAGLRHVPAWPTEVWIVPR